MSTIHVKHHYRTAVRAESVSHKSMLHRLGVGGLLLVSLVLLFNAADSSSNARKLEAGLADASLPLLSGISHPVQSLTQGMEGLKSIIAANADNQKLRAEVERLKALQIEAAQLKTENEALRLQLHAMPSMAHEYITARLLTDHRGSFAHSAIINAGSSQGVANGQAVVSADGLIGRVIATGNHSARVLMLTDNHSKIPVMSLASGRHGMLAGTGEGLPVLRYLAGAEALEVGEKLITSGVGGVFPKGLPVGVVKELGTDGVTSVKPAASMHALSYVSVIKQPMIAAPEAEAAAAAAEVAVPATQNAAP